MTAASRTGLGAVSRRTLLRGALMAGGAATVSLAAGACSILAPDPAKPTPGTFGSPTPPAGPVRYADIRGITADGELVPNLYPIHPSGVSTAPVVTAAQAVLGGLTATQRRVATFSVASDLWPQWSDEAGPARGIRLRDLGAAQQASVQALLAAALSPRALALSTNIRKLNRIGGKAAGRLGEWDQDLYFLAFFGAPSADGAWGFRFQGRHLCSTTSRWPTRWS